MNITCPSCRSSIPTDDINVSTDIALCRACGKTFSFSEIVGGSANDRADLNAPPAGAWFEQFPGGFRVGASTRSWMALFYIPFTCAWSGTSLFGIYGSQLKRGHFDVAGSLFGLPFVIGSCVLVALCAMSLAGKVEITQRDDQLLVFSGVGPLGWSRSFPWSDFRSVREDITLRQRSWNRQAMVIALEGKRRAAFGSMLSDERRYFVLSALRKMLRDANQSQPTAIKFASFR